MRRVTLADPINWAKDRLIDDMTDALNTKAEFCNPGFKYTGYCILSYKRQKKLQRAVAKFARLLALPIKFKSLGELRRAGYWNGAKDTFWEDTEMPAWYSQAKEG
jgi:hypothetical protein